MKTKIGCLHAHYANIAYIQNAFAPDEFEFVHFVDPGLMSRISSDSEFDDEKARNKVAEQVEWIAQTQVDAILITCTNYIALLEEDRLSTSVPIIKIDEPYFKQICRISEPQAILFTNPATVDGTMRRLSEYAASIQKPLPPIDVHVIANTFELFMQGKKEQYATEVSGYMNKLLAEGKYGHLSVAQISMVEPAETAERETGASIGNPLKTLVAEMSQLAAQWRP